MWLETEPPHLTLPQDNASGEMEITNEISSEKYFDIQKIESESEAHIVRESKDLSLTDETPEERDEKKHAYKKGPKHGSQDNRKRRATYWNKKSLHNQRR